MGMSLLLTAVFLLRGFCETEAVEQTGVVGQDITIKCSHSNANTNVKYFCKGSCYYQDILLTSKKTDSKGKYRLKDEGNTFYVTISDLKQEDAGIYWCGIERVGVDTYTNVIISIKEEDENLGGNNKSISSQTLVLIGAGLGGILLVLVTLILIFFRLKKRNDNTSSGKDNEMKLATSFDQRKDPSSVSSFSSDKESNSWINSSSKHLQDQDPEKSNISSEVFYSDISFSKQTDCISVTSQTQSTTYSSVKHKPKVSSHV